MDKYIRISTPLTSRMDMSYASGNGSLFGWYIKVLLWLLIMTINIKMYFIFSRNPLILWVLWVSLKRCFRSPRTSQTLSSNCFYYCFCSFHCVLAVCLPPLDVSLQQNMYFVLQMPWATSAVPALSWGGTPCLPLPSLLLGVETDVLQRSFQPK